MMRWLLLLLVAVASPALAAEPDPAAPSDKPTEFGAPVPEVPLVEVKPGDFEGMLRNCDVLRARAEVAKKQCEQDETNMPFLVGAYMALWAILLVFFVILSRRQARMRAEMLILRERLARLGDDAA